MPDELFSTDEAYWSPQNDPAAKKANKHFDWSELPALAPHSQAKLDILREYLLEYISICCGSLQPGVPSFSLYIIDGFCGGGEYQEEKLGSPLVILKTIEEAEYLVNLNRKTPIRLDARYWFVDESKPAIEHLKETLENHGYSDRINSQIFIRNSSFHDEYTNICSELRKAHPKDGARALFFLDQCGYKKVQPELIKDISKRLPKAEFIINYAVKWLTDYLSNKETAGALLKSAGIDKHLSIEDLEKSRETESNTSWAWTVESKVSVAYQKLSEMPYFSPFYIIPEDNHRGYWLLHLAPHARARQAMITVHWRHTNGSRHFGQHGLEILSYKPNHDSQLYTEGTLFDELEKSGAIQTLTEQLPKLISDRFAEGVQFDEFLSHICNDTNGDVSMLQNSLSESYVAGELVITGPKGGRKRKGNSSIGPKDVIKRSNQRILKLND